MFVCLNSGFGKIIFPYSPQVICIPHSQSFCLSEGGNSSHSWSFNWSMLNTTSGDQGTGTLNWLLFCWVLCFSALLLPYNIKIPKFFYLYIFESDLPHYFPNQASNIVCQYPIIIVCQNCWYIDIHSSVRTWSVYWKDMQNIVLSDGVLSCTNFLGLSKLA